MVKNKETVISNRYIEAVCKRLSENKRVRRSLPIWGRVHIDRQLPFLCIFRRRKTEENPLSRGLITGEASYLLASDSRKQHKQLSFLVKRIAETLKKSFGSFLIVEVWISQELHEENKTRDQNGGFKILRPRKTEISSTIETLERSLKRIKIRNHGAVVDIVKTAKIAPPGLPSLIVPTEAAKLNYHVIGIEVDPIYLANNTDEIFPLIFRKLKKGFSLALKNCFFEFTRKNTPFSPPHYHSLGRHSMVKAVWEVDKQLAEICKGFDFLLQVTPVNNEAAWSAFKRNHYNKKPRFVYRPIAIDPGLAKRKLFLIPIERIEDPTLAQLFRDQQLELDRKFTMLMDWETPRFLYGSLQLYGRANDSLMKSAYELLSRISPRSRDESLRHSIDAHSFSLRAEQELDHYRKTIPDLTSQIFIREDITGLLVSQGNLFIGTRLNIPATRVKALISHEIGTHVLTYLNGKSQPFQQLRIGLPAYDELQEGLAVLSEYFVGGLSGTRMRMLAARVIASHQMVEGAGFVDVFRELNQNYGFDLRTAFNLCVRTFRGGGLTKDIVYLRGLVKLLKYLENGGELEPLYIGKISAHHVPLIKELQWRKILHNAPLRPSYLDIPGVLDKMDALRNGMTLINLLRGWKK